MWIIEFLKSIPLEVWLLTGVLIFIIAELSCISLCGKELIYAMGLMTIRAIHRKRGDHIIPIPKHIFPLIDGQSLIIGSKVEVVASIPLVSEHGLIKLTSREACKPIGSKLYVTEIHASTMRLSAHPTTDDYSPTTS